MIIDIESKHKILDKLSAAVVCVGVGFYLLHGLIHDSAVKVLWLTAAFLASVLVAFALRKPAAKYALTVGVDFLMLTSLILSGLTVRAWVLLGTAMTLRLIVILKSVLVEHHTEELVDTLQYRATHDVLTDCGNRQLLEDSGVEFQHSDCDLISIISLDLDDFKAVNDKFGHEVGDAVLREAASRIKEAVRPSDRVVRIGGDEFAILLPDVPLERAKRAALRVQATLHSPMILTEDGDELLVTASLGVSTGSCENIETLLRDADRRQFTSKALGKDQVIA